MVLVFLFYFLESEIAKLGGGGGGVNYFDLFNHNPIIYGVHYIRVMMSVVGQLHKPLLPSFIIYSE